VLGGALRSRRAEHNGKAGGDDAMGIAAPLASGIPPRGSLREIIAGVPVLLREATWLG
jgi:hypothetical protein